jgi:hypothetical protein
MRRTLLVGTLLLLAGCQLPPERVPLTRLPENSPPLPYAELLTRARGQALYATEAAQLNHWPDLEDAARALEQTSRFIEKAGDVPANRKDLLPRVSSQMAQESRKLIEAAKAKQEKETDKSLETIHRLVRELRLQD